MHHYTLTAAESGAVARLGQHVSAEGGDAAAWHRARARQLGGELPPRMREAMSMLAAGHGDAAMLISGLPIGTVGPTPQHWRAAASPAHDLLLLLCGFGLGQPFAWPTQQDGALVHNVLPMRECEWEQVGFSSRERLWWHTEDAFHPHRPDYLALLCLRNAECAATTIAEVGELDLADSRYDVLFEPRYSIRPDHSHLPSFNSPAAVAKCPDGFEHILARQSSITGVAALWGPRTSPRMRLDPFFMQVLDDDSSAKDALEAVSAQIDAKLASVVLDPGDLLLLDNHRCVHGRAPFTARYDGEGRWLKRIVIARQRPDTTSGEHTGDDRDWPDADR